MSEEICSSMSIHCDLPFLNRSRSSLSFEQELDLLLSQITRVNFNDYGILIDRILTLSEYEQIRYLWTVLEPFMHRDFLLSNLISFPENNVSTLSTYITRELRERLEKAVNRDRKKCSYRISSSFIQSEKDVQNWTNNSVFPALDHKGLINKTASDLLSPNVSKKQHPFPGKHVNGSRLEESGFPSLKTKKATHVRTLTLQNAPLSSQTKKRHLQAKELARLPKPERDLKGTWSSHDRTHYNILKKEKANTDFISQRDGCISNDRTQTPKSLQFLGSSPKDRGIKVDECTKSLLSCFGKKWDDYQRKRFLQVFVKILQPSDIFYMYGLLLVRMNRDFISLLPANLSEYILTFLSPKDLCTTAKVSRQWNIRASSDSIWREKCKGIYIGIPFYYGLPFKEVYLKNKELLSNRSKGRFNVEEFDSGLNRVSTFSFYRDLIAVAGEKIIKVWNTRTNHHISTLIGHQKGIFGVKFYIWPFLLSCSNDSTLKMWNYESGICLRTFVGHDGGIWTMQTKKNTLVSGSVDKTARVWDLLKPQLLNTLHGHGGAVSSVEIDDYADRIFTASTDKIVRIWELPNGVCISSIPINEEGIPNTLISFSENHLLCAAGTHLSLWDVHDSMQITLIRQFQGHKSRLEAIQLCYFEKNGKHDNGLMASTSLDGKTRCWNPKSGECLIAQKASNHTINWIQLDDTKIMLSSQDPSIKIWRFINT